MINLGITHFYFFSTVTTHPLLAPFLHSSVVVQVCAKCCYLCSFPDFTNPAIHSNCIKAQPKKLNKKWNRRPLTITHTHTRAHTNTGHHCCLKVIRKGQIIFYSGGILLTPFSVAQVFGSDKQLSFTPARCVCLSACVSVCVYVCLFDRFGV